MLARRVLPTQFAAWNQKWGAPYGRRIVPGLSRGAHRVGLEHWVAPLLGPFAFQANSSTRAYEFPWAFHALRPRPELRVLEIGGALSGLQFALARSGCDVHNVDPFFDYGAGAYGSKPERRHAQLNQAFKTDVTLHKTVLPEAAIDESFDAVFSVSTLEHIPRDALIETLLASRRLLRPQGRIVLTVDLFLNLEPFSHRQSNQWGTNVAAKWIADVLELDLLEGTPSELLGYDEFSVDGVLADLDEYAINNDYPQLAQLMVFGRQ